MKKLNNRDSINNSLQSNSTKDSLNLSKTTKFIKGFKEVIFGDADAYFNLGISYAQVGNYVMALKKFRKAVKIDPNEWGALYSIGKVYAKMGDYHSATKAYRDAIKLQPNNCLLHNNLGVALGEVGKLIQALNSFEEIGRAHV